MSGGSIILQAAAKRLISPNSRLMLHYGFTWDEGTSDPRRLRENLREHEQTMDTLVNIYYSRGKTAKLTKRMLRERILPVETYFNAQQCIEYGLADEIIEPKDLQIV
jgi:ATP-dependent protease ClpP protease subunit